MNKSSSARSTGSRTVVLFFAAFAVAIFLLAIGGQVRSLILIGVGTIVYLAVNGWVVRGRGISAFLKLLPVTGITYLFVAALYFDNQAFTTAGFILLFGYMVWSNRSEIRWLVGRLRGGADD